MAADKKETSWSGLFLVVFVAAMFFHSRSEKSPSQSAVATVARPASTVQPSPANRAQLKAAVDGWLARHPEYGSNDLGNALLSTTKQIADRNPSMSITQAMDAADIQIKGNIAGQVAQAASGEERQYQYQPALTADYSDQQLDALEPQTQERRDYAYQAYSTGQSEQDDSFEQNTSGIGLPGRYRDIRDGQADEYIKVAPTRVWDPQTGTYHNLNGNNEIVD